MPRPTGMLQLAESHKAAPSSQAAAERQMKQADGVRHAPIDNGSVDEFLVHRGPVLSRKHKPSDAE